MRAPLGGIREGGGPRVPPPPRGTYLFHFYPPHRATDINDKEDVFGNRVHVVRSKKVDEIAIKYLKNRTSLWDKPSPTSAAQEDGVWEPREGTHGGREGRHRRGRSESCGLSLLPFLRRSEPFRHAVPLAPRSFAHPVPIHGLCSRHRVGHCRAPAPMSSRACGGLRPGGWLRA